MEVKTQNAVGVNSACDTDMIQNTFEELLNLCSPNRYGSFVSCAIDQKDSTVANLILRIPLCTKNSTEIISSLKNLLIFLNSSVPSCQNDDSNSSSNNATNCNSNNTDSMRSYSGDMMTVNTDSFEQIGQTCQAPNSNDTPMSTMSKSPKDLALHSAAEENSDTQWSFINLVNNGIKSIAEQNPRCLTAGESQICNEHYGNMDNGTQRNDNFNNILTTNMISAPMINFSAAQSLIMADSNSSNNSSSSGRCNNVGIGGSNNNSGSCISKSAMDKQVIQQFQEMESDASIQSIRSFSSMNLADDGQYQDHQRITSSTGMMISPGGNNNNNNNHIVNGNNSNGNSNTRSMGNQVLFIPQIDDNNHVSSAQGQQQLSAADAQRAMYPPHQVWDSQQFYSVLNFAAANQNDASSIVGMSNNNINAGDGTSNCSKPTSVSIAQVMEKNPLDTSDNNLRRNSYDNSNDTNGYLQNFYQFNSQTNNRPMMDDGTANMMRAANYNNLFVNGFGAHNSAPSIGLPIVYTDNTSMQFYNETGSAQRFGSGQLFFEHYSNNNILGNCNNQKFSQNIGNINCINTGNSGNSSNYMNQVAEIFPRFKKMNSLLLINSFTLDIIRIFEETMLKKNNNLSSFSTSVDIEKVPFNYSAPNRVISNYSIFMSRLCATICDMAEKLMGPDFKVSDHDELTCLIANSCILVLRSYSIQTNAFHSVAPKEIPRNLKISVLPIPQQESPSKAITEKRTNQSLISGVRLFSVLYKCAVKPEESIKAVLHMMKKMTEYWSFCQERKSKKNYTDIEERKSNLEKAMKYLNSISLSSNPGF